MDFGALPPEINSGRMYAGPGAGPIMAAAAAWDTLAAELRSTAAAYQLATSELAESWRGPASTAMAAAAAPYFGWMSHTAAQAQQTATQAAAAAAAYETAFAATVPPPVIAANRAQLMLLVATNLLGQNTPAIAATEAQYAEMWAQDAGAMYGYAASCSAATRLMPFSQPPQTTSPAGQSTQGAAVAQAVGTSTAAHSQTTLSQVMSTVPQQLQTLSTAGSSGSSTSAGSSVLSAFSGFNTLTGPATLGMQSSRTLTSALSGISGVQRLGIQAAGSEAANAVVPFSPNALGTGLSSGGAGGGVLGGLGRAASVGGLSVPPNWTAATPVAGAAQEPLWLSEPDLGAVSSEPLGGMLGGSPLARPMTGMLSRPTVANVLRVGPRRFAMPRPFAGG
jgi:PPE-repeat protein